MKNYLHIGLFALFVIGLGFEPLGMIRYKEVVKPGDTFYVHVGLVNIAHEGLENIQLSGYIPELELFTRSAKFDVANQATTGRTLVFDIPYNARQGLYLMIIGARNQDNINFRSTDVRYFWIE